MQTDTGDGNPLDATSREAAFLKSETFEAMLQCLAAQVVAVMGLQDYGVLGLWV